MARISPYLGSYDYCSTGKHEDDGATLGKLKAVTEIATRVGAFDETVLFRGENAVILKNEFKAHFRNVSRIMDCVGCGKCRLWGKVQTTGIATALKILFELDERVLDPVVNPHLLQRSEVVALINTLHRLSESLYAVDNFRRMWADTDETVSEKLIRDADRAVKRATHGTTPGAPEETMEPASHLGNLLSIATSVLKKLISYFRMPDRHAFPMNDEL